MTGRSGGSEGPEDVDAAFAEIVAGLEREGLGVRWSELLGPDAGEREDRRPADDQDTTNPPGRAWAAATPAAEEPAAGLPGPGGPSPAGLTRRPGHRVAADQLPGQLCCPDDAAVVAELRGADPGQRPVPGPGDHRRVVLARVVEEQRSRLGHPTA